MASLVRSAMPDPTSQDLAPITTEKPARWMWGAAKLRRSIVGVLVVLVVAASMVTIPSVPPAQAISYGDMVVYEMIFPVDGDNSFRDTFGDCRDGCARRHQGTDVYADKWTPVLAVSTGTIRYVNWSYSADLNPERCCSLVIDHDDGWQSRYIHLNNDTRGTDDGRGWGIADGLAPGSRVAAGQLIGWVGDSGNAETSNPQLHFELRAPGDIVTNPYQALVDATRIKRVDDPGGDDESLFDSPRTIRRGDRGAAVEQLQEVLNDLGYTAGAADGIFGGKTEAAVLAFQESNDLEADGLVGRKTKQALEDQWQPRPTLRRGDRSDDVAYLQGLLNDAGYDAGATDGIFGARTDGAVRSFQSDEGLTVDGIVGKRTWTALRT